MDIEEITKRLGYVIIALLAILFIIYLIANSTISSTITTNIPVNSLTDQIKSVPVIR